MANTRSISLHSLLVVPFVLQIFAAVGIVGYLSSKNGQQAVNDLASQLMDKTSQQVDQRLDNYLQMPMHLAQMNLKAIASGDLKLGDRSSSERYFWRQAQAFPEVGYTGYALSNGYQVGAGRWLRGLDVLVYENLAGAGKAADYAADAQGNHTQPVQVYDYNPLADKWYQDTMAAGKLSWTRIYAANFSNIKLTEYAKRLKNYQGLALDQRSSDYLAISASAPLLNPQGKPLGAINIDLLLPHLSQFLQTIRVSRSGQSFVMERNGFLVGSSSKIPIYDKQGDVVRRYQATDSPDALMRAIAQGIQQKFATFAAIQTTQTFNLTINGHSHYVQVTPWRDEWGLDWLVVVTVPESDFMAQIQANNRTTILLCLAALTVATLLGFLTARGIARPILAINHAAQAIAQGELAQQVALSHIRELDGVGQSFNHMAAQLQASFSALARSNAVLEDRVAERTQALSNKNTQLNSTLAELHRTQAQIVQTEKMSALGQMVAGVAHEINNPVNFIHGNLKYVKTYTQDLLDLVQTYQQHVPQPCSEIQVKIEDIDLDFLHQDLSKILGSMQVGTERIREIVLSLRNFSRLDEADLKAVDLHEGLDNALLILHHRFQATGDRPCIQVIKDYGDLPLVECYAGQLNQVFLNLLSNAIDALEERHQAQRSSPRDRAIDHAPILSLPPIPHSNPDQALDDQVLGDQNFSDQNFSDQNLDHQNLDHQGVDDQGLQAHCRWSPTLWIATTREPGDRVRVAIADNGIGISGAVQSQLFDPFFTTKPVGKGTGLGLSISYQIVTQQHKGKLWVSAELDQPTQFFIEIPMAPLSSNLAPSHAG